MKREMGLSIAVLLTAVTATLADPRPSTPCGPVRHGPSDCLRQCPDDYCSKPMPACYEISCGLRDDYCRKPYPRTWQMAVCGGCNDYERKSCPVVRLPANYSQYSCGALQRPATACPPSHVVHAKSVDPSPKPSSGKAVRPVRPTSPYNAE